jgi:hypothetical protein
MKKISLGLFTVLLSITAFAQKTTKSDTTKKVVVTPPKKFNCDSVVVDFETGLLNGKIGVSSPIDSIKKYLPCVSMEIPYASEDRVCGGGAVLEKPGIFFNLENGFIEFTPTTKAILPLKLFGVLEDDITAITGDPVQISDLQPYTDRAVQSVYLYPKSYGCLAVWVDQQDKKVFKIQLQNKPPASAFLCIE